MTDPVIQIDRSQENKVVDEFIRGARESYPILNIYSSFGLGLLDLFQNVHQTYQKKGVPVALVSIRSYQSSEEPYKLDQLINDILRSLNPTWNSTPKSNLDANLGELISLGTDKPAVVILNDYDRLPDGPRRIFEKAFLQGFDPLRSGFKIILGSEQKITFSEFPELGKLARHYKLPSITQENLMVTDERVKSIVPDMISRTDGLSPLIEFIGKQIGDAQMDANVKSQYEAIVSSQEYFEKVVSFVYSGLGYLALNGSTLKVFSVLRRFDVTLLSRLMPIVDLKKYVTLTQKNYLDLILALGTRVQWIVDGGGYTLKEPFKKIILSFIDDAFQRKIDEAVVEIYSNLILAEFRSQYVVELCFHQVRLSRSNLELESIKRLVNQQIIASIDRYLSTQNPVAEQIDELDDLRQMLLHDPDIASMIMPETFEYIKSKTRTITSPILPSLN